MFKIYFWDGTENWGDDYIVRRILERARFEILLKFPFNNVKKHIDKIRLETLWTGEKRKEFIIRLKPYIKDSNSWKEAIFKMIQPYFDKNK